MIDYGNGVRLRRIEDYDLPSLFTWRNDYRVWKWCRQFEPLHYSSHEKWFAWQSSDKSVSMFAIEGTDEKLIGVCGLTDIDLINRRAEFSLYIDPDKHGKGLGRSALLTLFKHGFDRLGLNLIWGETFDQNHATKLFERIGMKIDGIRRGFYFREGSPCDAILYSITKDELKC